ncbi:DUF4191 family protein [Bifidobacterium bombi]|uniref:Integral membrane protein n=1 Tax=Bifidobacterium bombi DSM 19703 TaxID=1341695 RepID=A0A080N323_9BIFI|nr:DUF4191 family protein [Bifidobacterium bombi]KFF31296.1 hypothetical protein BBOMB_0639 [Bifidobacterium bombi DSM 19703]
MANEKKPKEKKEKKPKIIKQIIQIYKYTHAEDKALPWLLTAVLLAPVLVVVVAGVLLHWGWLTWIMLVILAVMLGILFFTMLLTRRADKVGYAKMEGKPGAAVSVLGNINKAGFNFPQQPVWIDRKTKAAIWRGTGYNGIYLLAEGESTAIKREVDRQEHSIKGVTAGSAIPVYRIFVGNGTGQVRLKDLRSVVLKCKSYEPTDHSNFIMKKIHPRRRFLLTKEELDILNERLRTLQTKQGFGIPKGIDPTKPQRISRRAMRGR